MIRTVIPAKTLKTIDARPFRALLKRWECDAGCWPHFVTEYWDGYKLVRRDIMDPMPADTDVDPLIEKMKEDVAIIIAKRALRLD